MKTLKNTRHGSPSGNDGDGFCMATIKHPSPGSLIMSKIKYKYGQKVGECFYLRELPIHKFPSGQVRRLALFECGGCGCIFKAFIMNVKSGHTKSCGCYNSMKIIKRNYKHGLADSPMYSRWSDVIKRCYNPSCGAYKNYGGRGIKVCIEWRDDFKSFYDYMMALPGALEPGLTIDRIDNDRGYEPGNMRWTTYLIQRHNQRRVYNKKPES